MKIIFIKKLLTQQNSLLYIMSTLVNKKSILKRLTSESGTVEADRGYEKKRS